MVEEIIREGRWICPNCNAKNKGGNITCGSCGAARGNVRFIYEEDAEEITDQAEVAKALAGADWVCGYCNCSNEAARTVCKQCSAARDDGKNRERKDLELDADGHVRKPVSGSPERAKPPEAAAAAVPLKIQDPPGCWKAGCVTMILLLIALLGFDWMCTSVQTMEVTGLSWKRTLAVEEYKTIPKGDWVGAVPKNAKVISQSRKQRTTRDVPDGTYQDDEEYTVRKQTGTRRVKTGVQDLGNGRFKETYANEPVYSEETRTRKVTKTRYRKEPVYDTWVDYTVLEWKLLETLTTSGANDEPTWPRAEFPAFATPVEGSRRAGARTETYKAVLTGPKGEKIEVEKVDSKPLSCELFLKLRPGTNWKVQLSGFGLVNRIDPPQ